MSKKVLITNYNWEEDGFVSLNFCVLKKGFFGGLKPDRRFAGRVLNFHIQEGQIRDNFIQICDGNLQQLPLHLELINAVLAAAILTLEEEGVSEKADILAICRRDFVVSQLS
jgi:hypothetical protein